MLVTAFILFFSGGTLQAAITLSGGLSHEYNLQPGDTATKILELKNTGNRVAEVKIYQEDVQITQNGDTRFIKAIGSHPRSNARWVQLNTDRVVIAPGARKQISYTLQVPANPSMQGSYWSTLMLEPVSSQSAESQILSQASDNSSLFIRQKTRYSVRVLTDIGTQGAAYLSFDSPEIVKDTGESRWLNFNIINQGNLFTRPHVWLDVFNQQGANIGKFKAETHSMYAGERESFQINITNLRPGKYKALLAAEDNHSGQVFGSDINLNIQP